MKPGLILLLSGLAVLFLASSLLADDRAPTACRSSLPESTSANPGSLVGVRPSFDLERMPELDHSPVKTVLLSTAVPGLGQAANGRWAKASAFIALGSVLVARALVESEQADRFLHLSRNAATDQESRDYYASTPATSTGEAGSSGGRSPSGFTTCSTPTWTATSSGSRASKSSRTANSRSEAQNGYEEVRQEDQD